MWIQYYMFPIVRANRIVIVRKRKIGLKPQLLPANVVQLEPIISVLIGCLRMVSP